MKVAIYQQSGLAMSIISFGKSINPLEEAKRVTPKGISFWIVESSYIDDNFVDTEDTPRASWSIPANMQKSSPSGVGVKTH